MTSIYKSFKIISLLPCVFSILMCTSGCLQSWALKKGYKNQAAVEKIITELGTKHSQEQAKLEKEISKRYEESINAKSSQLQGAANGLYGADATYKTIVNPNRTDIVTNNFVNEAWAATGNLMPDHETMVKINERLKNDLDETKVSLEELKKTHVVQVAKNKELADTAAAKDKEIKELKEKRVQMEAEYQAKLLSKQGDLIALNKKLLDLEKERADDKEWVEKQKRWAMGIVGGLALLCVAGAVWMPIGKGKFAMMAVIFGLIAVGINFIQPWMVLTAAGVAILSIIGYAVYQHNKESDALKGVAGAIQEIKDKNTQLYNNDIKPLLDNWLTKYTKDGKTVPDKASQDLIDKRLMEQNMK